RDLLQRFQRKAPARPLLEGAQGRREGPGRVAQRDAGPALAEVDAHDPTGHRRGGSTQSDTSADSNGRPASSSPYRTCTVVAEPNANPHSPSPRARQRTSRTATGPPAASFRSPESSPTEKAQEGGSPSSGGPSAS